MKILWIIYIIVLYKIIWDSLVIWNSLVLFCPIHFFRSCCLFSFVTALSAFWGPGRWLTKSCSAQAYWTKMIMFTWTSQRQRYDRMILHGPWKICSWLPFFCIRHIGFSGHLIVILDKRDIFVRFLPGILNIRIIRILIFAINLIVARISYLMQKNECWQSSFFTNSAKCAECYTILSNLAFFSQKKQKHFPLI